MQRYYLIILCALLLSSCFRTDYKNEGKHVFRYNESAGITSLDPAFTKDQSNIWACNQLYNGLVQLDEQLRIQPCIASKWVISEDGKTYTFTLKKNVFFHKNLALKDKPRNVIASDFVYSFNRIVDEKIASPGAWIFNYVKKIDGKFAFTALNDSVLEIVLNQSFPPFLGLLSMQYCSVVPKEAIEFYGKDFRKNPVGTGPFQLKRWKEGVKMVLVKNENYFEYDKLDRLPYLDAIAITFIIDKQSVFLEFIKGNIDFMSGIDVSYKDELLTVNGKLNPKYENKFQLISQPYLNTEYLAFLMDSPNDIKNNPLKHLAVRQAINYGFDRVKMMRYLRNNIGTPALYGFIPKGLPGFDTSKIKGYDYQPDKSRKLLADAGFSNGENLGEITLSTTASYLDLCKYIQNQLIEIGLKIKIDVNPPATLREMIAKSKVSFFRGSWIADYPDAENYLSLFYSGNFCPMGPNYTHFSNPHFDLLYKKAQNEINDSLRYNYYNQMDQIIMNEAAVVVLYYDQVLRFVQNNIQGLGSNPMNLLTLKRVKKI
ncbi:MAG: ABC transporter substrate-binding protein [Bacteroidales bacterium]